MNTDSFIVYAITDDIYKYTAEDVERDFDTSNRKIIGLMKNGLGGKIIKNL